MRIKMSLCVQYRCKFFFMNIHNLWLGDSAAQKPLVSGLAVQMKHREAKAETGQFGYSREWLRSRRKKGGIRTDWKHGEKSFLWVYCLENL